MERSQSAPATRSAIESPTAMPDAPQLVFISKDSVQSRLLIAQLANQCGLRWSLLPPGALGFAERMFSPSLLIVDLLAGECTQEPLTVASRGSNESARDAPIVFLNAPMSAATRSDHIILTVAASFSAICKAITGALGESAQASVQGPNAPDLEALTPSERRILELLQYGLSNQRLADRLHKSPHTIKSHLYSVYQKLGCRNRAEAALIAARSAP